MERKKGGRIDESLIELHKAEMITAFCMLTTVVSIAFGGFAIFVWRRAMAIPVVSRWRGLSAMLPLAVSTVSAGIAFIFITISLILFIMSYRIKNKKI